MFRQILFTCFMALCIAGLLTGCKDPVSEEKEDEPQIPAGATALFTDGFEDDLSNWETNYMIYVGDFYPHMRITSDLGHTGTYSVTTDSNRTALVYNIAPRIETGIAGVQFYIMAEESGNINFTVELGQNAGSSGGLVNAFGIGFDVRNSIKSTSKDRNGRVDSLVSAIQPGYWYKCNVEVDFTTKTIHYYIDGAEVNIGTFPTVEMYGIDRLLVFRGEFAGQDDKYMVEEGPKRYFLDNIVLYTK